MIAASPRSDAAALPAHPGRDHARSGAIAAVAVLALVGRNREEQLPLARAAVLDAARARDPGVGRDARLRLLDEVRRMTWPATTLGWIDLGAGIADLGLFVLLAAAALSYAWTRRPASGWPVTALGDRRVGSTSSRLAVAWWAMSAKVPS